MSTDNPLRELGRLADRAADYLAKRDQLMRELRTEGYTLRELAPAARVSHQTVKNICEGRNPK